jgi:hypothetical protein
MVFFVIYLWKNVCFFWKNPCTLRQSAPWLVEKSRSNSLMILAKFDHDRTLFSRTLESWFILEESFPNGLKIQVSELLLLLLLLLFTQMIVPFFGIHLAGECSLAVLDSQMFLWARFTTNPSHGLNGRSPNVSGMSFQSENDDHLIWVNYNDLTATSLESWLVREIIPKWPQDSG